MKVYRVSRDYSSWDREGTYESYYFIDKEQALKKAQEIIDYQQDENDKYFHKSENTSDVRLYINNSEQYHTCELCGERKKYTRQEFIFIKEYETSDLVVKEEEEKEK